MRHGADGAGCVPVCPVGLPAVRRQHVCRHGGEGVRCGLPGGAGGACLADQVRQAEPDSVPQGGQVAGVCGLRPLRPGPAGRLPGHRCFLLCHVGPGGGGVRPGSLLHRHSPKLSMHNWYTQLYNQAVFEAIEETYGKGKACLYARSATVGGQQQPVHWGGDCESTFNGMAQTLRAGLSITSSGFGFWSHDIGGFEGAYPDPAVYKRWVAFGLLGSHSRMHGSTVYRVPWLFDEEDEKNGVVNAPGQTAVDVARTFTKLKLSLMPYLYQVGLQPHLHGTPVMRSMFVEFPDDPTCRTLDRQYMFGPDLLVAPVFTYSGDVEYYLPAGTWTNWFTGEKVVSEHGVWRNERHGFDTIPLWVRDGSVLVTKPGAETPEYEYGKDALVSVFLNDGDDAKAVVTEMDGSTVVFSARKTDAGVEVSSSDGRGFTARLGFGEAVTAPEGKVLL